MHNYFVSNQVSRVEAHAKLTNHGNVCSRLESLHESLRSGLCYGAQVINEICLGHSNARIDESYGLRLLIRNDLNEQIFLGLKLGWVSETLITNFVLKPKCIRVNKTISTGSRDIYITRGRSEL